MIQWSVEMNSLLNQCVLEAGYDFNSACDLLQARAINAPCFRSNSVNQITPRICEEQWMLLNPECDDEYCDSIKYLAMSDSTNENEKNSSELSPNVQLKIPLTEQEIDALLLRYPPSAPAKVLQSGSDDEYNVNNNEMHWVLSYLTNPDEIAQVDIESRELYYLNTIENDERYQQFLQELMLVQNSFSSLLTTDTRYPCATELDYLERPSKTKNTLPESTSEYFNEHRVQDSKELSIDKKWIFMSGSRDSDAYISDDDNDEEENEWQKQRQLIKTLSLTA